MTSDTDLVELTTAKTDIEAEWLVGALENLGVQTVAFGDLLADEFAMSQKLMGLSGGVRIMVARSELGAAREALARIEEDQPSAATSEDGDTSEEETADSDVAVSGSTGKTIAILLLAAATVALGWLSLKQHRQLSAWERQSPVTWSVWRTDRWVERWRDNSRLASIIVDRNGNGVYEESWTYDREGGLLRNSFDANQNGIYELTIETNPEGRELCRLIDEDENGVVEKFVYPAQDGVREQWLDANEDRRYERQEFVDARTGEVLSRFEDRGREGYVRVK